MRGKNSKMWAVSWPPGKQNSSPTATQQAGTAGVRRKMVSGWPRKGDGIEYLAKEKYSRDGASWCPEQPTQSHNLGQGPVQSSVGIWSDPELARGGRQPLTSRVIKDQSIYAQPKSSNLTRKGVHSEGDQDT